jgi:hypothetical protein
MVVMEVEIKNEKKKLFYLKFKSFLLSIRRQRTSPQGILWVALYLVLNLTFINFELLYLAPQYTMWGSQVRKYLLYFDFSFFTFLYIKTFMVTDIYV